MQEPNYGGLSASSWHHDMTGWHQQNERQKMAQRQDAILNQEALERRLKSTVGYHFKYPSEEAHYYRYERQNYIREKQAKYKKPFIEQLSDEILMYIDNQGFETWKSDIMENKDTIIHYKYQYLFHQLVLYYTDKLETAVYNKGIFYRIIGKKSRIRKLAYILYCLCNSEIISKYLNLEEKYFDGLTICEKLLDIVDKTDFKQKHLLILNTYDNMEPFELLSQADIIINTFHSRYTNAYWNWYSSWEDAVPKPLRDLNQLGRQFTLLINDEQEPQYIKIPVNLLENISYCILPVCTDQYSNKIISHQIYCYLKTWFECHENMSIEKMTIDNYEKKIRDLVIEFVDMSWLNKETITGPFLQYNRTFPTFNFEYCVMQDIRNQILEVKKILEAY